LRGYDQRLSDDVIMTPKKRPFCNAFTGCGRKRSSPNRQMPELVRQRQVGVVYIKSKFKIYCFY
ncbi:jg27628, partial [Pararge aegeria aegeria]